MVDKISAFPPLGSRFIGALTSSKTDKKNRTGEKCQYHPRINMYYLENAQRKACVFCAVFLLVSPPFCTRKQKHAYEVVSGISYAKREERNTRNRPRTTSNTYYSYLLPAVLF